MRNRSIQARHWNHGGNAERFSHRCGHSCIYDRWPAHRGSNDVYARNVAKPSQQLGLYGFRTHTCMAGYRRSSEYFRGDRQGTYAGCRSIATDTARRTTVRAGSAGRFFLTRVIPLKCRQTDRRAVDRHRDRPSRRRLHRDGPPPDEKHERSTRHFTRWRTTEGKPRRIGRTDRYRRSQNRCFRPSSSSPQS